MGESLSCSRNTVAFPLTAWFWKEIIRALETHNTNPKIHTHTYTHTPLLSPRFATAKC